MPLLLSVVSALQKTLPLQRRGFLYRLGMYVGMHVRRVSPVSASVRERNTSMWAYTVCFGPPLPSLPIIGTFSCCWLCDRLMASGARLLAQRFANQDQRRRLVGECPRRKSQQVEPRRQLFFAGQADVADDEYRGVCRHPRCHQLAQNGVGGAAAHIESEGGSGLRQRVPVERFAWRSPCEMVAARVALVSMVAILITAPLRCSAQIFQQISFLSNGSRARRPLFDIFSQKWLRCHRQ